ncbi:MAG: hypothetical protein M3N27_04870 [Thermoproteota archaeon]|nr:hypothetical protein [Thermoproteota archaeon]
MSRTISSFRISSIIEERKWKQFRNLLEKEDKKIFDEMFLLTRLYNAASYQCVRPVRIQSILMSIVFHHYKKLLQLYKTDIKFAKIDLT